MCDECKKTLCSGYLATAIILPKGISLRSTSSYFYYTLDMQENGQILQMSMMSIKDNELPRVGLYLNTRSSPLLTPPRGHFSGR